MKYSIIIPHHDIPRLLKRCIASIPRRDDTEIIVVDDASSKGNLQAVRKICNERPEQIKLIERDKNGGGGAARNDGLKAAKGELVIFCDSDDFFNYCVGDILDEYRNTDCDIVYFKSNCVDSETYANGDRTGYLNAMVDSWFRDKAEGEDKLRYFFGVPVCKIIKKRIIDQHHIAFDETPIHNDTTFAYTLGYYAGKITADRRCLYCATTRANSVSKQKSAEMILTTISILGREVKFFRAIGRHIAEDGLSQNLYILLRRKDFTNFKNGFSLLLEQGFNLHDLYDTYCKEVAKASITSTIWTVLYSPILYLKIKSFTYIPLSLVYTYKKNH